MILVRNPPFEFNAVKQTLQSLQSRRLAGPAYARDAFREIWGDDWSAEEVAALLWKAKELRVMNSTTNGFLTPTSDLDVMFQWPGKPKPGLHPIGLWVLLEFPFDPQVPIHFQIFHSEVAESFLKYPHLTLPVDQVLLRKESGEWNLQGRRLARLFLRNHKIRNGIRSAAEAAGQPLSETEIARQAITIQQHEITAAAAGLEAPGEEVSKWRGLSSWLRGGDPKRSSERLARLLRRNGEEHLYWRRALQWRIESKSGSPIRSLPGRWMDIVQLLRRPAFTAEEVTALLEKTEERPVLSPVHIQDPLGDWEMPLNEVLAVVSERKKGFIFGSLAAGFLTPDSEIELLFNWEGQGEEAVYADLRVPLKRGRPIRMGLFFPWDDSWLANHPFLPFQAETLLRENEFKEWIFNGSGWAALFRRNQEIREEVRSEGNAVGEVFSEIDVAVEAAALHRDELIPPASRDGDGAGEGEMTLQQAQVLMLLADMGKAEAAGDWLAVRKLLDENQPLLRQAQESADPVVRSFFRMIQRIRLNALAPLIESDPSLKAIVVRDFLAGLPGILSDMSSGEMPFVEQQEWSDWMSQALGFLIDKKALNLSEMISSPGVVPEAVLWLAMTQVSMSRFLAMAQQSGPAGNPLRDDEIQQALTRVLSYFMMAEVTAPSQQIWLDLNLDVAWVSLITDLLNIYRKIAFDVSGRVDQADPPFMRDVALSTVLWQGERMAPPDLLFREALLADDGATRFNAAAMGLKRLAWIARQSKQPETAEFMRRQAHHLADSVNQQHSAYAQSRFWGRNLFPDIFQSSGLEEVPGVVARELRGVGASTLVTRVHESLMRFRSAQDPETRPLALVQKGLLDREVVASLSEMGWQVEELPQNLSREVLPAQVTDVRRRWSGPLLVAVHSGWEETLKQLTAQGRITGVILDSGFPPEILLSFLNQVLVLPGRIFRLEYGIKTGLEESYAVSTQL